jgi:hypothetical protein
MSPSTMRPPVSMRTAYRRVQAHRSEVFRPDFETSATTGAIFCSRPPSHIWTVTGSQAMRVSVRRLRCSTFCMFGEGPGQACLQMHRNIFLRGTTGALLAQSAFPVFRADARRFKQQPPCCVQSPGVLFAVQTQGTLHSLSGR